jgi:hypothetical protein
MFETRISVLYDSRILILLPDRGSEAGRVAVFFFHLEVGNLTVAAQYRCRNVRSIVVK